MKRALFKSNFSIGLNFMISLILWGTSLALFADASEPPKIEIPKTLPAIWKAIDEHTTSINQAIKENKLTLIHEHVFAIRDLTQALPSWSKNLAQAQQKTLQDTLGYVNQLAIRLDKTGDANDKEATLANWNKLQKLLDQLRALY